MPCDSCGCVTTTPTTVGDDEVEMRCGNCSNYWVVPIPAEVADRVHELGDRVLGYRRAAIQIRTSTVAPSANAVAHRHRLRGLAAVDHDEIKRLNGAA